MASKHMKRYSVSLVIKERQIKTTVQYHLAPVKTTITTTTKKNPKDDKHWWLWRNWNACWWEMQHGETCYGNSIKVPQKFENRTGL